MGVSFMCEKSQPGQPIKMDKSWISEAVWNNAVWCDVVCATHGRPGDFPDGFWICRQKAPPFYPNLITLDKHLTTLYAQKLFEHHVSVEMHLFPEGGHAFGMGRKEDGTDQWVGLFVNWLKLKI